MNLEPYILTFYEHPNLPLKHLNCAFIKFLKYLQVEICRFGCPEHCDASAQYSRSEQSISASINIPNYNRNPKVDSNSAPRYLRRTQTNITPAVAAAPAVPAGGSPNIAQKKTGKAMRNVKENVGGGAPGLFGITLPKLPTLFQKNGGKQPQQDQQQVVNQQHQPQQHPSKRSGNVPLHRQGCRSHL